MLTTLSSKKSKKLLDIHNNCNVTTTNPSRPLLLPHELVTRLGTVPSTARRRDSGTLGSTNKIPPPARCSDIWYQGTCHPYKFHDNNNKKSPVNNTGPVDFQKIQSPTLRDVRSRKTLSEPTQIRGLRGGGGDRLHEAGSWLDTRLWLLDEIQHCHLPSAQVLPHTLLPPPLAQINLHR